jgi:hypothetical protein
MPTCSCPSSRLHWTRAGAISRDLNLHVRLACTPEAPPQNQRHKAKKPRHDFAAADTFSASSYLKALYLTHRPRRLSNPYPSGFGRYIVTSSWS